MMMMMFCPYHVLVAHKQQCLAKNNHLSWHIAAGENSHGLLKKHLCLGAVLPNHIKPTFFAGNGLKQYNMHLNLFRTLVQSVKTN